MSNKCQLEPCDEIAVWVVEQANGTLIRHYCVVHANEIIADPNNYAEIIDHIPLSER